MRINLLPHREARRQQQKKNFTLLLLMALLGGVALVLLVGQYFSAQLEHQERRNQFIHNENTRLDGQIKEVASLKQEIEGLKARQQAVEALQADRNQPVYLMTELVRQVPEGVYLKSLKQEEQGVRLTGQALSNARMSELLRNLNSQSAWLQQPELIEIRSGSATVGRSNRKLFDFTMDVALRRPSENAAAELAPLALQQAASIPSEKGPHE